jgi:hypothetical protein
MLDLNSEDLWMMAGRALQVRDSAKEVPKDYKAVEFRSKAVQHTQPELTWDTPDQKRSVLLQKRAAGDISDEDLQQQYMDFLASPSSGSDEEGHAQMHSSDGHDDLD